MTKQARYQQRAHADGLCFVCRSPLALFAWRCDFCQRKTTVQQRARIGCQPWRKGGRGRPPRVRI